MKHMYNTIWYLKIQCILNALVRKLVSSIFHGILSDILFLTGRGVELFNYGIIRRHHNS